MKISNGGRKENKTEKTTNTKSNRKNINHFDSEWTGVAQCLDGGWRIYKMHTILCSMFMFVRRRRLLFAQQPLTEYKSIQENMWNYHANAKAHSQASLTSKRRGRITIRWAIINYEIMFQFFIFVSTERNALEIRIKRKEIKAHNRPIHFKRQPLQRTVWTHDTTQWQHSTKKQMNCGKKRKELYKFTHMKKYIATKASSEWANDSDVMFECYFMKRKKCGSTFLRSYKRTRSHRLEWKEASDRSYTQTQWTLCSPANHALNSFCQVVIN